VQDERTGRSRGRARSLPTSMPESRPPMSTRSPSPDARAAEGWSGAVKWEEPRRKRRGKKVEQCRRGGQSGGVIENGCIEVLY
jgi:ribosomal protein S14